MNRKIFIVSLAIVFIIITLIGYSVFQKSQKSKKTELGTNFQVSNYQIPAGQINAPVIKPEEIAPSSGGTSGLRKSTGPIAPQSVIPPAISSAGSQKSKGSVPPQSVIPPAISRDYIKYYQDSIANLNKISPDIISVQQTLTTIQQKYQAGDNNALPPLVSQGKSQNSVLSADILAFKTSLDSWLLANNQTTDAAIKSKTGETIAIGKDFSQSTLDLSNATAGILNYNGTGDLNQLSQQFQTAAQKVNDLGKALIASFTELNNLLKNL